MPIKNNKLHFFFLSFVTDVYWYASIKRRDKTSEIVHRAFFVVFLIYNIDHNIMYIHDYLIILDLQGFSPTVFVYKSTYEYAQWKITAIDTFIEVYLPKFVRKTG